MEESSRILYVDATTASKQAEELLERSEVRHDVQTFSSFPHVPDAKPPCLLTSEGRFCGVEEIRWYIDLYGGPPRRAG